MDIPNYLQVGAFVKVRYWFARVMDICHSETRCMILCASPNAIWRGKHQEWVEFEPDVFAPATYEEADKSIDIDIRHVETARQELNELRTAWAQRHEAEK